MALIVGDNVYVIRQFNMYTHQLVTEQNKGDSGKKIWVTSPHKERIIVVNGNTYKTTVSDPDFLEERNVFPITMWEQCAAECLKRNKRISKKMS
jgi:hypothetical protein